MSFSLKLFSGIALAGETGPLTGPVAQRHRLALLALLAAARPRAVSRDKLMAGLWSERESEPARRLLNQAVHAVRQALGAARSDDGFPAIIHAHHVIAVLNQGAAQHSADGLIVVHQ